jgi:hypothetical protein
MKIDNYGWLTGSCFDVAADQPAFYSTACARSILEQETQKAKKSKA